MSQFNAGDTVRLKSGGPTMTVIEKSGSECTCQWFDSNDKINYGSFPAAGLIPVQPGSGPAIV